MRRYTIIRSANTYEVEEASPDQLLEVIKNINPKSLTHHYRKVLRRNVEIYADNPENNGIRDKVINLILENVPRTVLFKDHNMLTHTTNNNEIIICSIVAIQKNVTGCYFASNIWKNRLLKKY